MNVYFMQQMPEEMTRQQVNYFIFKMFSLVSLGGKNLWMLIGVPVFTPGVF